VFCAIDVIAGKVSYATWVDSTVATALRLRENAAASCAT
jgi:hypothetical protein